MLPDGSSIRPDETLCSVVVVNRNGGPYLAECLDSLERQDEEDVRVIVSDNGSTDESEAICRRHDALFLRNEHNLGPCQARNIGAAKAASPYVLFIDNDMRADRRLISVMLETIVSRPEVFAVDSKHLETESGRQLHGRIRLRPGGIRDALPLIAMDYIGEPDELSEVVSGSGCMMVRKSMFVKLGGYDPQFFIDIDELDLCWRAWMHGWATIYEPRAIAYHTVGQGTRMARALTNTLRMESHDRNLIRFLLKTMSPCLGSALLAGKVTQMIGAVFLGRTDTARSLAKAFVGNLRSSGSILESRRTLQQGVRLTSRDILRRFLAS